MFKRIVVLSLMACLVGCLGEQSTQRSSENYQGPSELVRPVSHLSLSTTTIGLEPELMHAAPDECIAFAAWSGVTAKEGSANPADKLLSNPLFVEPFEKLAGGLAMVPYVDIGSKQLASSKPVEKFVLLESLKQSPEMAKLLYSKPGIAFINISAPEKFGMPNIDAAIVIRAGDQADAVYQHIQRGVSPFGEPGKTVTVQGATFSTMEVNFEGIPLELVFGASQGNFIVGMGAKSVEGVVSRFKGGKAPKWFADTVVAKEPWQGLTEYIMFNVEGAVELGGGMPQEVEAFNFEDISTVEMVTGRTEDGVLHRLIVNGGQRPLGAEASVPVDFSKFAHIPADAQAVMIGGASPEKGYRLALRRMQQLDEYAYRDFQLMEEGLKKELGINLQADILSNLGSNFSVHTALNDDLLGGMVFSVDIKNQQALEGVTTKMLDLARKQISQGSYYGPTFRMWKYGDYNVTSFIDRYFVIEPCWCVTGERLFFSFSPEAMKTYLAPPTAAPLFENDALTKLFAREGGAKPGEQLISAGYVDMKTLAYVAYPFVRGTLSEFKSIVYRQFPDNASGQSLMTLAQNAELPPLRSIVDGLGPMTLAVRVNDDAVEFELKHTLPLLNPLGSVAVGFTNMLPVLKKDGRSMSGTRNNLRQVSLACLNFESAHGHLPADIVDENGKPLLSWRVRILPYVEQNNLFDSFRLDEPWDSEHNQKLLEQIPDLYSSTNPNVERGFTTIRGNGGENGIFLDGGKGARFRDISDGASNTIMTVNTSPEFAVEWTKPGALDGNTVDIGKLIGNQGEMPFSFVDCSVSRLPKIKESDKFRLLFTRNDGQYTDISEIVANSVIEEVENPLANAFQKALSETQEKVYGQVEILSRPRRGGWKRKARGFAVPEAKDAAVRKIEMIEKKIEMIEKKEAIGSDSR